MPQRHLSGKDEVGENRRQDAKDHLCGDHQVALRNFVGNNAGGNAQEQDWSELEDIDQAELEGRGVETIDHEPGLGERLHPGASDGDQLARKEETIVSVPECDKAARESA